MQRAGEKQRLSQRRQPIEERRWRVDADGQHEDLTHYLASQIGKRVSKLEGER